MSESTWGITWRSKTTHYTGRSTKPFAATQAEAEATCETLNREYPDLEHAPLHMEGFRR